MGDPVVHFEIGARDWSRACAFYSELFDWSVTGDPARYGVVDTRSGFGIPGGVMQALPGSRSWFTVYIAVDDVERALVKAEELGGRRVAGPLAVGPGQPSFGMVADPEGNVIGLFEKPA